MPKNQDDFLHGRSMALFEIRCVILTELIKSPI